MDRDTDQPLHSAQYCSLGTLKRRADFLRLRGGARWGTPAFLIEGKPRPAQDRDGTREIVEPSVARFGYTVTKRQGNAVTRNRMRRRLKEAVRLVAPKHARPGYDYVLVARAAAAERSFDMITHDLIEAFQRLARPAKGRNRRRK